MKKLLSILVLSLLFFSTSKADESPVCDWVVNEVYADLLKEGSDDHLFVVVGTDGRCEYGRGTDKYQGLSECEKHKKVNLIDGICKLFAIGEKKTGKFSEKTLKNAEKLFGCIEGNCSNGKGTYKWDNGTEYSGDWEFGLQNGQGVLTWTNGAKYIGEFKKNKRHGKGTYFYENGTKYVGEFQNNEFHGKGKTFWNDGVVEIAEWENGNVIKTVSISKNFIFKKATTFVDNDIIKKSDPSNFKDVVFVEKEQLLDFDKRTFKNRKTSWKKTNFSVFVFRASFENTDDILIKVNDEFKDLKKAEKQAIKFGKIFGQMPAFLRKKVKYLIIHKGNPSWAGGNGSAVIHTNTFINENKKYIEESMFHELVHASLDWQWGKKSIEEDKWLNAITTDKYYISDYAWEYPEQEDLAETVLWWYASRCKKDRISKKNYEKVNKFLSNRFKYLDNQNYETFPSVCE